MLSRRLALVAGSFLFLAFLSVLPAAAAGASTPSCGILPWEQMSAPAAAGLTPVDPAQGLPFTLDTSCTSSSQCPSGQQCHCGQCHDTCPTGWRWNCTCQVCYKCGPGQFFDDSLCVCAAI